MNPAYLSPLANHLWQSTLFAGVAGMLIPLLRNNRARVRHGVWLVASLKFLIPFSVLTSLGGHLSWRTTPQTMRSNLSFVIDSVSRPFTAPGLPTIETAAALPAASKVPPLLWTIWACGLLGISGSWWVRWRRIRAAVRVGSPVQLDLPIRAVFSPTLLEPGVFGVFRPVILLPEGVLDRLTAAQLNGVIAHELCHVHHRDNLIAAVHMFVETVFWFHPLVWWIGKRMIEEREHACDEEVLRLGGEPRVYAEGILNVCKLYAESPLTCVSGVAGANLRKRITAIMKNRRARSLGIAKKAVLSIAAAAAVALPIAIGIVDARAVEAQAPASAQSAPGPRRQFEVASIKPSASPYHGNAKIIRIEPGMLTIKGMSLKDLIQRAYGRGYSLELSQSDFVSGGPKWCDADLYDVEAKPGGNPNGTGEEVSEMLKSLLAERFTLALHHETKEASGYLLVVGTGGPKLKSRSPGDGGEPLMRGWTRPERGGGVRGTWRDASMTMVADRLGGTLDRPVIDKTGLTGTFDLDLTWAPDETQFGGRYAGSPENPNLPSLVTALREQVGLRLETGKVPIDVIVIDHAEKPTEN